MIDWVVRNSISLDANVFLKNISNPNIIWNNVEEWVSVFKH